MKLILGRLKYSYFNLVSECFEMYQLQVLYSVLKSERDFMVMVSDDGEKCKPILVWSRMKCNLLYADTRN